MVGLMNKPIQLLVALACGVALVAPPAASAGNGLPMGEAREQIHFATDMWAGLLDGKARVKSCKRTSARAVRCDVVIESAATRCEMRISVVRSTRHDTVRARGLRCSQQS
jgi:hypothetical protein